MNFLYDQQGKRKYLTIEERKAFLRAAKNTNREVYTFCATLAYTGARISEVLALVPERFDFVEGTIVIECLKKRQPGINRAVPVPASLLLDLDQIHKIRSRQKSLITSRQRLWKLGRTTAWKQVKHTMALAGVIGPQACPKGLRHSFGVTAIQMRAPISLVQKWLGHSRIETTAIYTDAVGEEERAIASQVWRSF